jgi:carboxypeptidase Q
VERAWVTFGLACLLAAAPRGLHAQVPASVEEARPAANRLIAQIKEESARHGHALLGELCTTVGPRLSGSPGLEKAVAWAQVQMKAAGLENVHVEPVTIPHWVRGNESCEVVSSPGRKLAMLGLGNSVGTPKEGITADLVVVSSFEELSSLPRATVAGKIVLFDPPWNGYGRNVVFRLRGFLEAAAKGAVACLVRSASDAEGLPHTGSVWGNPFTPTSIPTAALAIEDAAYLHQLAARPAPVRVRLQMDGQVLAPASGANVIGELRGREIPDEIIILSAHLDSWDVGQGAQDDGVGCILSLEAARAMLKAGLRPRRTIRVVFWATEEYGGLGARAYAKTQGIEMQKVIAAFEADTGNGRPLGFGWKGGDRAAHIVKRLRGYQPLLEPLGAASLEPDAYPGTDIEALEYPGVALFGLHNDMRHYFEIHHCAADTFDRVNLQDFTLNLEAYALMGYLVADLPQ